MVRFRLSRPARADLAHILATSAERWGIEGRHRYAAIVAAAMRKAAADPEGPVTRDRAELLPAFAAFTYGTPATTTWRRRWRGLYTFSTIA